MGDQTSPFLVACPSLNTEKTTCPRFVFEDTTIGFSSVKLETSLIFPLFWDYVPSFDLRRLVALYHISE